jgi:hypothetical protein
MPIKLAVMLPSSKTRREIPGKLLGSDFDGSPIRRMTTSMRNQERRFASLG